MALVMRVYGSELSEYSWAVIRVTAEDIARWQQYVLSAGLMKEWNHEELYAVSFWDPSLEVYPHSLEDELEDYDIDNYVFVPGFATPVAISSTECDMIHVQADGDLHWSCHPKHGTTELETVEVNLKDVEAAWAEHAQ